MFCRRHKERYSDEVKNNFMTRFSVSHVVYLPTTRQVEVGRIAVRGQPGQNVIEIPFNEVVSTCHPSQARRVNWKIVAQVGLGNKLETLFPKGQIIKKQEVRLRWYSTCLACVRL
jgi:hypothetical protein